MFVLLLSCSFDSKYGFLSWLLNVQQQCLLLSRWSTTVIRGQLKRSARAPLR